MAFGFHSTIFWITTERVASESLRLFDLSSRQVDAAVRYIHERRDEVMAEYELILAARAVRPAYQAAYAAHELPDDAQRTVGWRGGHRVRGILADINSGKHLRAVLTVWHSDVWRDIWLGALLSLFPLEAL